MFKVKTTLCCQHHRDDARISFNWKITSKTHEYHQHLFRVKNNYNHQNNSTIKKKKIKASWSSSFMLLWRYKKWVYDKIQESSRVNSLTSDSVIKVMEREEIVIHISPSVDLTLKKLSSIYKDKNKFSAGVVFTHSCLTFNFISIL